MNAIAKATIFFNEANYAQNFLYRFEISKKQYQLLLESKQLSNLIDPFLSNLAD